MGLSVKTRTAAGEAGEADVYPIGVGVAVKALRALLPADSLAMTGSLKGWGQTFEMLAGRAHRGLSVEDQLVRGRAPRKRQSLGGEYSMSAGSKQDAGPSPPFDSRVLPIFLSKSTDTEQQEKAMASTMIRPLLSKAVAAGAGAARTARGSQVGAARMAIRAISTSTPARSDSLFVVRDVLWKRSRFKD